MYNIMRDFICFSADKDLFTPVLNCLPVFLDVNCNLFAPLNVYGDIIVYVQSNSR
jgi:hypothetical protein